MDKLNTGLMVALIGMVTVFTALVGLIIVITIINKVVNSSDSRKNQKNDEMKSLKELVPTVKVNNKKSANLIMLDEDNDELVAVITAAIAASLNRSTHSIIVRSVRRIPGISPAWNRLSRQEQVLNTLR